MYTNADGESSYSLDNSLIGLNQSSNESFDNEIIKPSELLYDNSTESIRNAIRVSPRGPRPRSEILEGLGETVRFKGRMAENSNEFADEGC